MEEDLKGFLTAQANRSSGFDLKSASISLSMLSWAPLANRDAVLAFYAGVVDQSIELEISKGGQDRADQRSNAKKILNEFVEAAEKWLEENPKAWSPILANWCLNVLGDVSSKHIGKVCTVL